MVDIIFAVNDPRRGPNAIFYETDSNEKDPSLPLKVAIKSQLTLSLMDKDAVINQSDAVLPFADIKKISFSFLFTIRDEQGSNITASISYLVPQSENISLYRKIPALKEKMQGIAKAFQNFTYSAGNALPKQFIEPLTSLLNFEKQVKQPTATPSIEITSERASGTPDYLIKKIKKNLEFVFFDLLVEKPIIVCGKSKIAVEYAMASLDFLTPHRELKKIIFSESYVDLKKLPESIDILGVSSKFEKQYTKEYSVIDVDKFEIHGNLKGNKSFFKDFINEEKSQDYQTISQDLRIFINDLLNSTHIITELFATFESPTREAIDEITSNFKTDEKQAIIEIASVHNPLIADKIRKNVADKVTGWLDDFS